MASPSISIVIPSFNYGRFLTDTLASVADLPAESVEIIVQDGGSTDDTLEQLKAAESDSFRWWSEPDDGQSDALNKAIAHARGDWIAWLNADEFYFPGALEKLLKVGEATGADIVFGDTVDVDEEGRYLRLVPEHRFDRTVLRWYGCFISTCACLLRRDSLGATPLDPQLKWGIMDWDLYLRLASEGARFEYVSYPVGAFRVHDSRITADPDMFADTYPIVRDRHGTPSNKHIRTLGRGIHGALKLADGGFKKQRNGRRFEGLDMRWFAGEKGNQSFVRFLEDVYGVRPPN